MAKQVVVLTSFRGKSGKDTIVELLREVGLKVARVAFADALKEECAEVIGVPVGDCHDQREKDRPRAGLCIAELPASDYKRFLEERYPHALDDPLSVRWHLQAYGTEYVRIHRRRPLYWVNKGLEAVLNGLSDPSVDLVVVTDCRNINELETLQKLPNVTSVRVMRDWLEPDVDQAPLHSSDTALNKVHMDAIVTNMWGNLDALRRQLAVIVPEYGRKRHQAIADSAHTVLEFKGAISQ